MSETISKKTWEADRIDALAKQVEENFQPDPDEPRVNAYVCNECGHVEITVDCAEGSTPMAIPCLRPPEGKTSAILGPDGKPLSEAKRCGGFMQSSWYCVKPEDYEFNAIKYEWRAADAEFYLRLRRKNPALAEHIRTGGLLLCKRERKHPVVLHSGEFMAEDGTILTDEQIGALRTNLEKLNALIALHTANVEEAAKKRKGVLERRAQLRAKRKAKNRAKR